MRKGFTLLELIIVIIILGVLATLGLTQYGKMIERSRGAEAKAILGDIRKLAYAYRLERGSITGITSGDVNIGDPTVNPEFIPSTCTDAQKSHYFQYSIGTPTDPTIEIEATRCTGTTGKTPGAKVAGTLKLTSTLTTGVDVWSSSGEY